MNHIWIDNIIAGLIDTYNTNDVFELLDCLNIRIYKIDSNNIMIKNNDSLYYRDYLNNEVIFIRNDIPSNLEKFILLHELGHALLHTDIYQAAFNRKFINTGKLEKQANYFAFKLMNINFDHIDLDGLTIEQISCILGLPCNQLFEFINLKEVIT